MVAALLTLVAQEAGLARQDLDPPRSPRNASYTLTATLDPAGRSIEATGRISWRNVTSVPATELLLHLYWNAWRDPSSTWMSEQRLGRNADLLLRPPEDRGWIDVSRLTRIDADGRTDLTPGMRFIAPDDGNRDDRTLLEVPLDQPVAPGETIELDVAWSAGVPRTFARTGAIGDYFFIAQWFPKVAVLEESGWNARQFHAATEFFADFGVYDVRLTVPTGWVVGATGREVEQVDHPDGTTTHRYVQADVHDFAWTTSPDFVDQMDEFEELGLPRVTMRLLLQPEHRDQAGRHFEATRAALRYYGRWFGPYPYRQITVVDPVPIVHGDTQGSGTGGMEYPTLFTAGTRWSAPLAGTQPESVTIHEAGHQFWYGIVATNEFDHAWMDEGLNTFSTARVLAEAMPDRFVAVNRYFGGLLAWPFDDVRWSREIDGNRLNAFRPVAGYDVPATPTWQYWPGTAGAITYNKTALWLATLERHLGWPTVQQILATHFSRGAFRHPTPDEFFAIANDVSGRDLTWFFDQVYRSNATFDYAVDHVQVVDSGDQFRSTAVVRRHGAGIFPIDVRFTFEDGSSTTERIDGQAVWQALTVTSTSRLATVEVDPDRVLLLDLDYTNNSWTAEPRAREAAGRWAWRWLTWVEELLLTYAFFA